MPTEQTRRVLNDYFTAMGTGQFTQFFTDDVTWTTVENNAVVRGSSHVQDAILALHARMSDMQTRQLITPEDMATVILFIGSPVNRQIIGEIIRVTGGR